MQLNDTDEFYYSEQIGTAVRIAKTEHGSMILQTVGGLHYIALDAAERDGRISSSLVERAADRSAAERMLTEYHSQTEEQTHTRTEETRRRRR